MSKQTKQYFILTSAGIKFEISKLDYNNIKGRIASGRTNGWYAQRGETFGDWNDWAIQFKDMAACLTTGTRKVRKLAIDENKRAPLPVGKIEKVVDTSCHDWNDRSTWEYVAVNVEGKNRYHKKCTTCGARSVLIKVREVELDMEANGKTLNDVPFVK